MFGKHRKASSDEGGNRSGDWAKKTPEQKADLFDASIDHSERLAAQRDPLRPAPIEGGDKQSGGNIGISADGKTARRVW